MPNTQNTAHGVDRSTGESTRFTLPRWLRRIVVWFAAEAFLFRSVVQEARQAEFAVGHEATPGLVVARRRAWIVGKGVIVGVSGRWPGS